VTSLQFDYPRARDLSSRALTTASPAAPSERWRRLLNVVVAIVGIVVTAPLMLLTALAVRLTSRGSVLYTQTRVGLDRRGDDGTPEGVRRRENLGGRPFKIYKFRTMTVQQVPDAEVWAAPDDPRVTPVGRVLRKLRLDELPQLWNVLRGDMNIVGPRPEQPKIFVHLRHQIHQYETRQRVRPGITGLAQINQHYDRCLDDVKRKVAFDLEYITRQSVMEDLKIMVLTIPVIAFRRGAW